MSYPSLFLISSIVVLAVILAVLVAFIILRRKTKKELTGTDYRYFFYMGIAYLAVGAGLSIAFPADISYFNFFTILGIIFTAMGFSNIDKWRKK